MNNDIKQFTEFNDYYIGTGAAVRSKNPDFHIFRFNELGNKLVERLGPFKTAYYQFALGANLSSHVSVFNKNFITEEYTMVIFIPGQIIKWERTGVWDGYVINVKEHFLNKALLQQQLDSYQYLQNMQPLFFSMSKEEYLGLSNMYELLIAEHQKLGKENLFVIDNLMQVLLIYINRIKKQSNKLESPQGTFSFIKYHEVANNFKSLVYKNYLENKSVAFYARALDLTTDALNKQVKQVFNKSPKEFINEVILLHSQTVLKSPGSTVKEVSFELNFDDYSHFVKFFKKMTGISPAEYKKQAS